MLYSADARVQADPRVRDYAHLASALARVISQSRSDPMDEARMAGCADHLG